MKPECEIARRSSLMNLGREVDYAVRALAYLAAKPVGAPIRRIDIGEAQDIPEHYLAKILRKAVRAGLVYSEVGPRGGFWLARPADEISLLSVYESLNGPLCLMACLADPSVCSYLPACGQARVWKELQRSVERSMEAVKLAAMADGEGLKARCRPSAG